VTAASRASAGPVRKSSSGRVRRFGRSSSTVMRVPTRLDNFDSPGGIPCAWLQAIPRTAELISEVVTDGDRTDSDQREATLAGESLNKLGQTGHTGDSAGQGWFSGTTSRSGRSLKVNLLQVCSTCRPRIRVTRIQLGAHAESSCRPSRRRTHSAPENPPTPFEES
jgi:hypothetical protein